jgi:hypothetical protein
MRKKLFAALAAVAAILAGYGVYTNVSPYTLESSIEDFTGVAVPFYEHWLHTDTLPMFGAMNAALAHRVTGG